MPNPVPRAYFRWDIDNPFLPRRELEATFYYRFGDGVPMKVVLAPMSRDINSWKFSLTFGRSFEFPNSDFMSPRKIVVFIKLDRDLITRKQIPDAEFIEHRIQERIAIKSHTSMHRLTIIIDFDLPDREEPSTHFFNRYDLIYLSKNMKQVLRNEENTNMVLWSANNTRAFRAHSYLIYWRWNNFFRVHRNEREIHTNISERVLANILRYMYCGQLRRFEHPKDCTELCQVIDGYELAHLYKVLVKNDYKQKRLTLNNAITVSHLFPLEIAEDRTISNSSFTWQINTRRICEWPEQPRLAFRIVMRNEAGNWISYAVKSRSTITVYVEVNLEVVKRVEGDQEASQYAFGRDLVLEPNETVRSGPVICLSFPETFGNVDEQNGRYFIRCHISISNGAQVQVLKSRGDRSYQDIVERCDVLNDHMSKLNEQRRFSQMGVQSRPGEPGEVQTTERVHHEILRARVPLWWMGFVNAHQDSMPYCTTCNFLSRQSLPIVFDYIYTGKVRNIPRSCIDEMMQFAERTDFRVLANLVNRYRRRLINQ